MKLNILERVMAMQTIAEYKQGNFITSKTLATLKDKLLVNSEEIGKYELKVVDDNYVWNQLGNTEYVDFDFTEGEVKLVKDKLIQLDKEERLIIPQHISLYEKFVQNI